LKSKPKQKQKSSLPPRRLTHWIAECGTASRRQATELVQQGLVTVNRQVVTDPALKINPSRDKVRVEDALIKPPRSRTYFLVHKPMSFLSTTSDPKGRPTVMDLVPHGGRRLYPVGRLDYQTQGLLLLTDDGEAANRLLHPRYGIPRVYRAKVKGHPKKGSWNRMVKGVRWKGDFINAKSAREIRKTRSNTWLEIVMTQGRYHEVRKLCAAIGHPVVRLQRTAFGPLKLGRLGVGQWRSLTDGERKRLKEYLDRHEG
jgi:23S rRNA pseudouridine2605 synthase